MSNLSLITEPNSINPEKIFAVLKRFLKTKGIDITINHSIDTLEYYIAKYLGVRMSESLKNKLNAYKTLLTSDQVFTQWQVFHNVANFIVDGLGEAWILSPIEDVELIITLHLLKEHRPDGKFSEEVKKYIVQMWTKQFGLVTSHPLLKHFGIEIPTIDKRLDDLYEKIKGRKDIVEVLNNGGFEEFDEIQLKKRYILDKALEQFINFSIEDTWL